MLKNMGDRVGDCVGVIVVSDVSVGEERLFECC